MKRSGRSVVLLDTQLCEASRKEGRKGKRAKDDCVLSVV